MHDPFGRVPTGASKLKGARGSVHSMDEAMTAMSNRFQRIVEGVNFRAMAEETNQTIDELMMELQQDINNYKTTGHCSDKLKDFLMVHSHAKKQMADEAVNPNNPFYKKQNDYDLPPSMRGHGTPDYKLPDVKAHDNRNRDDYRDRAGLDPLHDELNELARLAGIQTEDPEAEMEGNAFTGKLKNTAKGDKFDLDGKTYTDTSTLDEEPNEGNEFSGELAKARAQHKDSFNVDGKEYPVKEDGSDDSDMAGEEDVTPGGNTYTYVFDENNNTTKFTYTDANGQSQSFEIYYDSNVRGFDPHEVHDSTDPKHQAPVLGNQIITHDDMPEIIDRLIAAPTGVNEADAPVDTKGANPVNKPKAKYYSMKASTMNPGEGDAGEKAMHANKPTFKNGDNPLSKTAVTPVKEAILSLEARLAAEYESIKKVSK